MITRARIGAALAATALGVGLWSAPPSTAQGDCPNVFRVYSRHSASVPVRASVTVPGATISGGGASLNGEDVVPPTTIAQEPRTVTVGPARQGGAGLWFGGLGCLVGRGPDIRYFEPGAAQVLIETDAQPIDGTGGAPAITMLAQDWDPVTASYTTLETTELTMLADEDGVWVANGGWMDIPAGADALTLQARFTIKPSRLFETTYRHAGADPEGQR